MVDLIDAVFEGIVEAIDWLISQFLDGLQSGYQSLVEAMFGTPTPMTESPFVFGEPTNPPWDTIRESLVGGEITLIALLLLVMSVQGRHTIRLFSIGSVYKARKTSKTAWVGSFLIVSWYWIGTTTLFLVDGFTVALLPGLDSISLLMLQFLGESISNPALGLLLTSLGALSMWCLEALLYIRRILLYIYLYTIPIGLALYYGNIPVLSNIAYGFCKRFVPLCVLPLPAAIVFKGYDLIYSGRALSPATPFLRYLVAISLPLIALFVTWKTFKYATPLTAKVIGGTTKGAATIGGVAAGAYVAGGSIATTAARWGPKAAAGQAVAQKIGSDNGTADGNGKPAYRRTENDPGGTTSASTGKRGMEFDRGIQ